MRTHSPQTQLTFGSVFITGTVVLSSKSSCVISLTLSTWWDVTLVSLQDPASPCSKSIWFCKTNTLITAVPSHVTKQGYIRTILEHHIGNSFFKDLFHNFQNHICCITKHLPALYTTWREITMLRGALHMFLPGAKETQATYPTLFM